MCFISPTGILLNKAPFIYCQATAKRILYRIKFLVVVPYTSKLNFDNKNHSDQRQSASLILRYKTGTEDTILFIHSKNAVSLNYIIQGQSPVSPRKPY